MSAPEPVPVPVWGELRGKRKLPGVLRVLVAGQHAGAIEHTGDGWTAQAHGLRPAPPSTRDTADAALQAIVRSSWPVLPEKLTKAPSPVNRFAHPSRRYTGVTTAKRIREPTHSKGHRMTTRRSFSRPRLVSATVLALIMTAFVFAQTASAAPLPGSRHGTNYIHTCGYITCSEYYSHAATVQFDQAIQKGDFMPAGLAGTGCDLGAGGALAFKVITATTFELVAIPCGVIASVSLVLSNVQGIIHHAATSNGCMRFQSPRGIKAVRFAVYADHSALCHSMD